MADDLHRAAHMSHCGGSEYEGSCKYGEDETCPALNPETASDRLEAHMTGSTPPQGEETSYAAFRDGFRAGQSRGQRPPFGIGDAAACDEAWADYWQFRRPAELPSTPSSLPIAPDHVLTMRADGWTVAVHNDYRLNGEFHTFWLWTHAASGRFVKGEGKSDAEALAACVEAVLLTAAPQPPSPGQGDETLIRELEAELHDRRRGTSTRPDLNAKRIAEIEAELAELRAAPPSSGETEAVARELEIANEVERQADCLEGYAEHAGHPAKPVPSVFHLQAGHFRAMASELQEIFSPKANGGEGTDHNRLAPDLLTRLVEGTDGEAAAMVVLESVLVGAMLYFRPDPRQAAEYLDTLTARVLERMRP